ncbi:hypothetical protein C2845_PM06G25040 [Panicum miliaceum]|uniref:Abnormal spindle-like microcephaly-associated protein n=1 Tax=Panicum miliaceum TaxID=4540 RepID=A0A3L6RCF5_PANMI|nr:hypothetical protein C2845_PM06G25040 [Panicum miliaceum]
MHRKDPGRCTEPGRDLGASRGLSRRTPGDDSPGPRCRTLPGGRAPLAGRRPSSSAAFTLKGLPLLASTSLARELTRLGVPVMSMEQRIPENKSHMGLLYDWVQETQTGCRKELFTCHELDTLTDITSCPSSKMGKVLVDVLQDIPGSNILADGVLIDEKSAVLFLAFLSSHLTIAKRLDRLKNLINRRLDYESLETKISARYRSGGKNDVKYQPPQEDNKDGSCTNHEWAATIIHLRRRSLIAKNKYCKRKEAIFILQGAMKAWSATTLKRNCCPLTIAATTPWQAHENYNRYFICIIERNRFVQMRKSAIIIQQVVRVWIRGRKRLENNEPFERYEFPEGSSSLQTYTRLCVLDQSQQRKCHQSLELKIVLHSVIRLQRWWRKFLFHQSIRTSVISIQSFVRGWLARKQLNRSFVNAYLVSKASRLQKSSAKVDDSMRLINRQAAALSQLRTATEYSKKCCETLVTAGAVDILLNKIHSLNRGIPDQEILKQVFLTLRNIARYPDLRQVFVNTPESAETIFQELLRNKAAAFFIASDILKKLCQSKEGHETAQALHHHIKMLRVLVQDLEKKVELDKRNGRTGAVKENNLRRLREAATLHHLLTCDV